MLLVFTPFIKSSLTSGWSYSRVALIRKISQVGFSHTGSYDFLVVRFLSIWSTYNRSWMFGEFWSHAGIGLAICCSESHDMSCEWSYDSRTSRRAVYISRRRSCNQSAQVVRRCMFSHSEVLRQVARPIVRGYNHLYDKTHHVWQSSVHDR